MSKQRQRVDWAEEENGPERSHLGDAAAVVFSAGCAHGAELMRGFRLLLVPALFGLALLTIAVVTRTGILERKNPGLPISIGMREALGQMDLSPEDRDVVTRRYPNATLTSSGLRYVVLEPGTGEMPRRGHYLAVHYREQLLDGTVTDDTYTRGEGPFNFQLGQGRVMPAWEEVLPAMRKGEKRLLIVPYWLGYGEKGQRGRIPRKATILVEVELVDVR